MAQYTGKVWVLGDDIDTDIIIPTEYLALKTIEDMKQYGFSPLRPELAGQIQPGDIAKSFARIFYRNALNNGLLLLEQPELHDVVKEGDTITVTVNEDVDYNGKKYPIASLPENLMEIIEAGGLVKAMRRRNGLD